VEEENGAVREPEPDDVDVTPEPEVELVWMDDEPVSEPDPTLDPDPDADPLVAEKVPPVSVAVTGQTVVVV
jgi:hypothetical protein